MQQIMRFEQPLIHRMQWRSSRGEVNVSQMQKDCILSPSSFIFTVKTRESACRFIFFKYSDKNVWNISCDDAGTIEINTLCITTY